MSSLEFNKIAGAVLVGGIVALLSGLVTDRLFMGAGHDAATNAAAGGVASTAPAPLEPVSPLLAAADPVLGQTVAKKCATCHSFEKDGPNKVGPNLWNVVNAQPAQKADFAYSQAMAGVGEAWTYEHLNRFLQSPRQAVPGTKMSFAGLPKAEERAAVIAYLRSLSDSPAPLPTAEEIKAATDAFEAAKTAAEAPPAPAIDVPPAGETGAQTDVAAAAAPIAERLKTADAAVGEKSAKKCATCHSFEKGGPNKIGPNLWGVVGADTAHIEGFSYSKALAGLNKMWDYEALDQFLTAPRTFAPGTKMSFAGIKDETERAAIIAYLRNLSDNPQPLP